MRNKIDTVLEDKIINQANPDKVENIKKIGFVQKINKNNFKQKYSKAINFIFFEIIFSLLYKRITSFCSIKININKEGNNQIFSDEYIGPLPSNIYVNEMSIPFINKTISVDNIENPIYLEWNTSIYNFSFMFSNLSSITSVEINNEIPINCNLSYIHHNCNIEYDIQDMRGMFYNCSSLLTFHFQNLYIDYYKTNIDITKIGYDEMNSTNIYKINYIYNEVNISYMFYNCTSLKSIIFNTCDFKYINDMRNMFYNCFSLTSIALPTIYTNTNKNINISYMFYNCSKLENFLLNNFGITDMTYMFYNCTSLTTVTYNYSYYDSRSSIPINMSHLFFNCHNLESIEIEFKYYSISDANLMFYNCTSLPFLNFNPYDITININMAKMFYNCKNIENITFNVSWNMNTITYYFYPINLSYAFYNCSSLTNLELNYFRTDYLKDINYMFLNCKNLKRLSLINSNFSNKLITNMKGMFQDLESLTSLDLSSFYTPKVGIMWNMFKNCKSLVYLNISNFDTSKVTDMESMFEGCESLMSLSLVNFKTTKVHYMNKMFRNCISLKSLYFNYITSESLGTMQQMFYNCKSLEYLNIYSLTEKLQSISEIFEKVSNNFTLCIKENENIPNIFKEFYKRSDIKRDCSEDCYGFGNKRPEIIEKKICCPKFEFNGNCIDKCPSKMRDTNDDKICKPFNCTEPYYYNYNQDGCITKDKILIGYYINDTNSRTIDKCHETCETCNRGPTNNKANCETCNNNYKYFYLGNCLESCKNGSYEESGITKCKCVTEECSNCTEESLENGLCVECNEGYYIKSDENITIMNYKKCYKDPQKYYLDNVARIYKPCHPSCKECFGYGNSNFHNCSECDSNLTFAVKYLDKNCYKNCKYYYFDDNNKYKCTEKDECPHDFNFLIEELGQCVRTCNDVSGYNKIFKNKCYKECPLDISSPREENPNSCKPKCPYNFPFELVEKAICVESCSIMERSKKLCITNYFGNRTNMDIQEIIKADIKNDLLNKFDYTIITENKTILIEENQTNYEIVTSKNNNPNSNTTSINLGECEKKLKDYYGIEEDKYLFILVIDAYVEGKTGPLTLYEVYYPLSDSILSKLDLTICEGIKVNILLNIEIENPELYDKNNPIYNDMCYPYSSKDGIDMVLTDVQDEYKNKNKSICGEGCDYEYTNKQILCNCEIKETLPLMSELKIEKNKLYKFSNIKNIANFGVLKCVNLLVIKERMISNIGLYLFIPTFISYILCLIIFYKNDFKNIKSQIKNLSYAIQNIEYLKSETKEKLEEKPIIIKENKFLEPIIVSLAKEKGLVDREIMLVNKNININNINSNENNSSNKLKENLSLEENKREVFIKSKTIDNHHKYKNYLENNNNIDNLNDVVIIKKKLKNSPPKKNEPILNKINAQKSRNKQQLKDLKNDSTTDKLSKTKIEKEKERIKQIISYNDKELNDLKLEQALEYDKRNFIQLYYSFLKTDHILIKIFNSTDYNSLIIKIYLFFYSFSLSFTINALFFNDDTIHKIMEDEGKFNILYQIPQIIYSSIISYILNMILEFLALSEDKILEFKNERIAEKALEKFRNLLNILESRFIYFFILSFLFLLLFWYYAICFCAVYKNTQYHLMKDNIIGFITGLLTPLGTKLIPAFLRIIGIKKKNNYFFLISKILQIFI